MPPAVKPGLPRTRDILDVEVCQFAVTELPDYSQHCEGVPPLRRRVATNSAKAACGVGRLCCPIRGTHRTEPPQPQRVQRKSGHNLAEWRSRGMSRRVGEASGFHFPSLLTCMRLTRDAAPARGVRRAVRLGDRLDARDPPGRASGMPRRYVPEVEMGLCDSTTPCQHGGQPRRPLYVQVSSGSSRTRAVHRSVGCSRFGHGSYEVWLPECGPLLSRGPLLAVDQAAGR